jgi:hypothetical protein
MKTLIDEQDGGLVFCSAKAHLQSRGSVLSEQQIASWISAEVTNRKKGKAASGAGTRVKSLANHLAVFKEFKAQHPSSYWKVDAVSTVKLLKSMFYLFDIPTTGLKKVDLFQKWQNMKFEQSVVDAQVNDVEHRIHSLEFAILASRGGGNDESLQYQQQRLVEENSLISAMEGSA